MLKDLEKVGNKYELVKVRSGYGRNFLIPQGYAIVANEANRKKLDDFKSQEAAKAAETRGEVEALAARLKDVVLEIGAKAGTSGKIFGSVTNVQIAAALKEKIGLEVDRRKIILPEEIKMVGSYSAKLDMHPDVEVNVAFEVIAE